MERVILSQSMLLTSIIDFLISSMFTYSGKINLSLGFAACVVFVMMFIASFVTMTPSNAELDHLDRALNDGESLLKK